MRLVQIKLGDKGRRGINFTWIGYLIVSFVIGSEIVLLFPKSSSSTIGGLFRLVPTTTASSLSVAAVKSAATTLLSSQTNSKTYIVFLQSQKQRRRIQATRRSKKFLHYNCRPRIIIHPTYYSSLDIRTYIDDMLHTSLLLSKNHVSFFLSKSNSNRLLTASSITRTPIAFVYNPLIRSKKLNDNYQRIIYPTVNDETKCHYYFHTSNKIRMSSSSSSNHNKRANLPFSIMDKEIEEYTNSLGDNKKIDNTETVEKDTDDNGSSNKKKQRLESNGKSITEYEKWVRRLYSTNLFMPVKLGLENMERIHTALGNPSDNIIIIHIAGTNGKGSVTYKIAQTIQLSNPILKVGLFFSPHVSSFRERMQINNVIISEEDVVQFLPPIYNICQKEDIPATFFEITTALAFSYYSKMGCDVIVLETGLGGRLDATNIIKKPALSVITSIGLEHTKILGDTIELIAIEKGGIIKSECPVLVGPKCPHDVLKQCAIDKNASKYYTCDDVLGSNSENYDTDDYDLENARIAKAALKLIQQSNYGKQLNIVDSMTDEVIELGISKRPPCRFEIMKMPISTSAEETKTEEINEMLTVILDVAHNPPAIEYLVRKLHRTYDQTTKFRIVVGMSSDKDLKLCGSSLLNIVNNDTSRIYLVEAAHPRAAKLEAILNATGLQDTQIHYDLNDRSITTQLLNAKNEIIHNIIMKNKKNDNNNEEEILIVCGSVFLMSEAREALGIDEPRDTDAITEVAGAGSRHSQENFGNNQSYKDDAVEENNDSNKVVMEDNDDPSKK